MIYSFIVIVLSCQFRSNSVLFYNHELTWGFASKLPKPNEIFLFKKSMIILILMLKNGFDAPSI